MKKVFIMMAGSGLLRCSAAEKLDIELTDESRELKRILVGIFNREDMVLAVSTGTPGPFRKITAMIMAPDGQVLGYTKIGETPLAIGRIKHEAAALMALIKLKLGNRVKYPQNMFEGEIGKAYILVQSPPNFIARSGDRRFNEDYAEIIKVLTESTVVTKKFITSEFFIRLKEKIGAYPVSFRELLQKGLDRLKGGIGDTDVSFALSHGDFAPWNMLWRDKKVFVYDWESARFDLPAGIDIAHFLFQTGSLNQKMRGKKLFNHVLSGGPYNLLRDMVKYPMLTPERLLLCYVLHMAVQDDLADILSPDAVARRDLLKLALTQ